MKITLISPYYNFNSYGIRSISTYLRNKGIAVSTVYLINSFYTPYKKEIFKQLVKLCFDSDLIGISVMSNYFMNCVQITRAIKDRLNIPIVWGGVHPTIIPEECVSYCDIGIIGEGEQTLSEIIDSIKNNKPVYTIQGTFVNREGRIYKNNIRPLMQTELLPIIDNNFLSDYILLKDRICKMNFGILKKFMTGDYETLSSFGCPFSCSYCINNRLKKIYSNKVRFRKIDDVINELISAKERMPFIRHVSFDDDAFIQRDIKELKEFAEKYKEKVNLPFFVSGIHPVFVTDEKIRLLISAGMDRLRMGIESGSERSKKIYHRYIPNDKVIAAARIINKYKKRLKLTAFDLILDNPFESKEDVLETINLLSKLPTPFTLSLFSLTFYPGTDIYEKAISARYIKDKLKVVYQKHYHDIDINYLNFIILLFTVFKIPDLMLKMLLNKKIIKRDIGVPKMIFQFVKLIGLARRSIDFLLKGDPYTLSRHLKIRLIKI